MTNLENEIEAKAKAAGFTLTKALVFGYVAADAPFDIVNHEFVEAIIERQLTDAEHNELGDKEEAARLDLKNIFGTVLPA